jgi:hypothetical protein
MGPIKVLTRAVHKVADLAMFLVVGNDYTYIYNVSWVRSMHPIARHPSGGVHVFSQLFLVAFFHALRDEGSGTVCREGGKAHIVCGFPVVVASKPRDRARGDVLSIFPSILINNTCRRDGDITRFAGGPQAGPSGVCSWSQRHDHHDRISRYCQLCNHPFQDAIYGLATNSSGQCAEFPPTFFPQVATSLTIS